MTVKQSIDHAKEKHKPIYEKIKNTSSSAECVINSIVMFTVSNNLH